MFNNIQIIVAEDDPEDVFIMQMMSKELSFSDTIHFVKDGVYVLDYLEGLHENQMPMLIILDLNMPRLSGTQTLEALKQDERYKNIPVIIYSTFLNEIQMKACMKLGAKAYIIKPNTYEEGLKTMQQFHDYSIGSIAYPAMTG
ncbi:CheY-like chemotaxis protein [Chitinophaga niastensis]|uniref:CheY-like chemotaxis protein n=1 Tax=Chitinophaga niastensis TaxID=536980 RepID=A0A2P8HK24_CHINA|nr:response regulator [Chitinophaga niastensis]PSL46566.1 CheY-like chemotaxis protein [Chitinophaga niastensis]